MRGCLFFWDSRKGPQTGFGGQTDSLTPTQRCPTLGLSIQDGLERDELLKCRLIAASAGGGAMIEVLEQTLLQHAVEG
jgi:hypothetical protein